MKSRLEAQMKELMDDANVHELMPGFDQDALWPAIAAGLPAPPVRKRPFPGRVLAAAAILLVLLTCGRYYQTTLSESPVAAVARSARDGAAQVASPALVANTPPSGPPATPAHNAAARTIPVARPLAPSPVSAPPVAAGQRTERLPEPSIERVPVPQSADARVARQQVIHYLDLEEDEAGQPAVASGSKPLIQVKLNKPEYSTVGQAQKPFKELAFAIGK